MEGLFYRQGSIAFSGSFSVPTGKKKLRRTPAVPGVTADVLWTVKGQAADIFRVTYHSGSRQSG